MRQILSIFFLLFLLGCNQSNNSGNIPVKKEESIVNKVEAIELSTAKKIEWADYEISVTQPVSRNIYNKETALQKERLYNVSVVATELDSSDSYPERLVTKQTRTASLLNTIKRASPSYRENRTTDIQCFDVDEGMSYSYVRTSFQDSKGNIWIGTNGGGVSVYNGAEFKHISQKEGLPGNIVRSITEDLQGNIWLGTWNGGLCKYDGKTFVSYDLDSTVLKENIVSLLCDDVGNVWIGTTGMGVYKYSAGKFIHITEKKGLCSNVVNCILQDHAGDIWFGTDKGICKYNVSGWSKIELLNEANPPYITQITEDRFGNVWFGTLGSGLISYQKQAYYTLNESHGLPSNFIRCITSDNVGNIWMGTDAEGIIKYDGSDFTFLSTANGISNNSIMGLLTDKENNIWVSTNGGGVCKIKIDGSQHFTTEQGLPNNSIFNFTEGKDGDLWLGTYGKGYAIMNDSTIQIFDKTNGLPTNNISCFHLDAENKMWIGTWGNGVIVYDKDRYYHLTDKEGLCSNIVRNITEDQDGKIWMGTEGGGLCYYQDATITTITNPSIKNLVITSPFVSSNGEIWFGTWGNGVIMYDGKNISHFNKENGLCNDIIMCVSEDDNGNMLFGSFGSGVSIFDGQYFETINRDQGLSSDIILSMIKDYSGRIWMGTDKGITVLSYYNSDDFECAQLGKQDGLKSLDYNPLSVVIDKKNRIWFGGGKALTMFNLSTEILKPKEYQVEINNVLLDQKQVAFRLMGEDEKNQQQIKFSSVTPYNNCPVGLELPHYMNELTIDFSVIDVQNPHRVLYTYKLNGLNKDWSVPGKESSTSFNNLGEGKYVFRVKAKSDNGEWGRESIFNFVIYPPWWKTWWAILLYLLLSVFTVYIIVVLRTKKLTKRQRELEVIVDERTEEIEKQRDIAENQRCLVESKNKEILDSITYAKRIQTAILPSDDIVKKYLPDSFILYMPKDIVAGDFYWLETLTSSVSTTSSDPNQNIILFAAADCTGHGVPGAMVSVVCYNALNRAVREFGLINPAEILDKVQSLVLETFENSKEEVKDGMDIALCSLELFVPGSMVQSSSLSENVFSEEIDELRTQNSVTGTREPETVAKLKYAGANNPLWIIRDGELIEFKADKQPIGKFSEHTPFSLVEIDLKKDDTIYIFSDGYIDQFGGENLPAGKAGGKKFKSKAFKSALLQAQSMTMQRQKEYLTKTLQTWQGNFEQVDDICVIGVKI